MEFFLEIIQPGRGKAAPGGRENRFQAEPFRVVWSEERHLAVHIAPVGAVCLGVD
jgi:hypothetical protein